MPSLSYGTSAYQRTNGDLPPLSLINMFVEAAKTSEQGITLLSRPGLGTLATNGSGPINGIFSNRGTLSGDDFSVSSSTLYRGTVSKGTVTGSGPTGFAGSATEILIARGSSLYNYNGTNLIAVTFPDSATVRAVCFIGSTFVAVRGDGAFPGRFYWSDVLDGRTWDALNYATAEREPDDLLDIAALNDKIILYGQSTIEVWADTGDASLRFSRIEGIGSQSKGIIATGCQCSADNTQFHVGSDAVVYRMAGVFTRISDHWLETKIAASTAVKMFTFRYQGHEFVCVRLDSNTYAFDCVTQEWCEFQTNGGNWIAQCAAMKGTVAYFGHSSTGTIMGWSGWADLSAALTREFTAATQLDQPVSVNNLWLWVDSGASTVLSGQGSAPVMEMASSRDAGNNWTDFDDASIGNASVGGAGQYRVIPQWRRVGQFDQPGMMFRFRVSDPVPIRISSVKFNEPLGGRSRG
ncbi:MAG: phage stabilization protein [Bradyrhizobium sp.]|nr:phage stabilization protein [Bradyrhizobium sp.]